MLDEIKKELQRIGATDAAVSMDRDFEPAAGELVKIQLKGAHWHLMPAEFMELLGKVPTGAGGDAIHRAIEKRGQHVWHGPSPEGSRDTSG